MNIKVVITIFQSSAVRQTVLGGLTMNHPVENFGLYMCQKLQKLIENRLSYCNENRVQFFWPTRYL